VATQAKEKLLAAQRMVDRYAAEAIQQIDLRIAELVQHAEDETAAYWKEVRRLAMALLDEDGSAGKQ